MARHLKNDTSIRLYRAIVSAHLLHGEKSCFSYRHHILLLKRFHLGCPHNILNIHWSDFIISIEVLEEVFKRSYITQVSTTRGCIRIQNEELLLAQDHTVWRVLPWPSRKMNIKVTIQGQLEKIIWCLLY